VVWIPADGDQAGGVDDAFKAVGAAEQVLGHRTTRRSEPEDTHPVASSVHGVIVPKVGYQ